VSEETEETIDAQSNARLPWLLLWSAPCGKAVILV
jgi:hypothetical protein